MLTGPAVWPCGGLKVSTKVWPVVSEPLYWICTSLAWVGLAPVPFSTTRYCTPLGKRLHAGLGLVLRQVGIALGLVGGRVLVELRLGLGDLALLHGLHGGAELVDGNRRILLRVTVLDGLDDGADVDGFTAFDQVAAEVVTERIAQLAFLGGGVLRRSGAGDHGQSREGGGEQTQLHSVDLQIGPLWWVHQAIGAVEPPHLDGVG